MFLYLKRFSAACEEVGRQRAAAAAAAAAARAAAAAAAAAAAVPSTTPPPKKLRAKKQNHVGCVAALGCAAGGTKLFTSVEGM